MSNALQDPLEGKVVLIADCETSGFLSNPDLKFWMLQIGTLDGQDSVIYSDLIPAGMETCLKTPPRPLAEGLKMLREADYVVFHNGLSFDMHAINRFFPGTLTEDRILDTLVMARLAEPQERNHTLDAWGKRTGTVKDKYLGDYQQIDVPFLTYSETDVMAGRALFQAVRHVLTWGRAYRLEHDVHLALLAQEANGFCLDVKAAEALDVTLRTRKHELEASLKETFPPIRRETWIVPKVNNKARGYVKGEKCISKSWDEEFNPGSRQHIAERLSLLGWVCKEFTPEGAPKIDEEVLSKMDYPEAALLSEYFDTTKLLGMVSDGANAWLRLVGPDGRIHGRVNGNGARTGRMSHSKPNMAQIPKKGGVRKLFKPRLGWKLVGVDGESIQLRILAHYLNRYDGGSLADKIVVGRKEDGTDAHSANLAALKHLGLTTRDGAKTMIYALLFGSSPGGLAHTLKNACKDDGAKPVKMNHYALGEAAKKALIVGMPGLDKLEAAAQSRIEAQGYIVGLDGRRIYTTSKRLALVSLCQGGEAAVMKLALITFRRAWAHSEGVTWGLCASVHDEQQIEAHPDYASLIGAAFAEAITAAGVELGVKCHMAGKAQIGDDWHSTH